MATLQRVGPRRLTARPPRNLLQWLRLREIRPAQHRNLPTAIFGVLQKTSSRNEEATTSDLYISIAMKLRNICANLQRGPDYQMILAEIDELSDRIDNVEKDGDLCVTIAMDNGLVEILFHLLRIMHCPLETQTTVLLRKKYREDLAFFVNVICSQERPDYDERLIVQILSPFQLTQDTLLPLELLRLEEQMSLSVQVRYRAALFLSDALRIKTPQAFGRLWTKFKEGVYLAVTTGKFTEDYHFLVRMDQVVENFVHEAYCIASCVESLLEQPLVDERRHLIHFASLRLQELLCIIHCLITRWEFYCDCAHCKAIPTRIVCAGLPRLVLVLILVASKVSVADKSMIEAYFTMLYKIIFYMAQEWNTPGMELWYTLYSMHDLGLLIRIVEDSVDDPDFWPGAVDHDNYLDLLRDARCRLLGMRPVKPIIGPPFADIPFEMFRQGPKSYEPILSIRKFNELYNPEVAGATFLLPLKYCFFVIENKIINNWPDKCFWEAYEYFKRKRIKESETL